MALRLSFSPRANKYFFFHTTRGSITKQCQTLIYRFDRKTMRACVYVCALHCNVVVVVIGPMNICVVDDNLAQNSIRLDV